MHMKKILVLTTVFVLQNTICLYACTVCKSQQPKVLRAITHGVGPQSAWDYVIVWSSCVLILVTLILSVRCLVNPNEEDPGHIKNMIVEKN
jgi:hypothetical protein